MVFLVLAPLISCAETLNLCTSRIQKRLYSSNDLDKVHQLCWVDALKLLFGGLIVGILFGVDDGDVA